MAWTLDFTAHGKDQIGELSATWNAGQPDEFRFQKSVNLGDENSVSDFIAEAGKQRDLKAAEPDKTTPALDTILARMTE